MSVSAIKDNAALIISMISLFFAVLSYLNARKGRMQTQDAAFFKQKLELLKGYKEIEVAWQYVVNDLSHEIDLLQQIAHSVPNFTVVEELQGNLESFSSALLDAKAVRSCREKEFDSLTKADVEREIRSIEMQKLTLQQCREELRRKSARLAEKVKAAVDAGIYGSVDKPR